MRTIIQFIKDECVFHSDMEWSGDKFTMIGLPHKTGKDMVGIYFIVIKYKNKLYVLKVGKADGQQGFYKRFNMYINDSCDSSIVATMPSVLKKFPSGTLKMYYHPMPKEVRKYKGFTIESRVDTRGFEITMSRLAKSEGHPMLLSKVE
jgi:hypothetical protein